MVFWFAYARKLPSHRPHTANSGLHSHTRYFAVIWLPCSPASMRGTLVDHPLHPDPVLPAGSGAMQLGNFLRRCGLTRGVAFPTVHSFVSTAEAVVGCPNADELCGCCTPDRATLRGRCL
jgi:hypothetical protein